MKLDGKRGGTLQKEEFKNEDTFAVFKAQGFKNGGRFQ